VDKAGLDIAVMAILIAPWLAFNWRASGTPFPNTFYAKQLEYASILTTLSLPSDLPGVFCAVRRRTSATRAGLVAAAWSLIATSASRKHGFDQSAWSGPSRTWDVCAAPARHVSAWPVRDAGDSHLDRLRLGGTATLCA